MFLSRAMPSTIRMSSCEFMIPRYLVLGYSVLATIQLSPTPNKKGQPISGGPQFRAEPVEKRQAAYGEAPCPVGSGTIASASMCPCVSDRMGGLAVAC